MTWPLSWPSPMSVHGKVFRGGLILLLWSRHWHIKVRICYILCEGKFTVKTTGKYSALIICNTRISCAVLRSNVVARQTSATYDGGSYHHSQSKSPTKPRDMTRHQLRHRWELFFFVFVFFFKKKCFYEYRSAHFQIILHLFVNSSVSPMLVNPARLVFIVKNISLFSKKQGLRLYSFSVNDNIDIKIFRPIL